MIALLNTVEDRLKVISELAALEARSAICRRQASGDITLAEGKLAIGLMERNLTRFTNGPFTPTVLRFAVELVDRRNLRALDSIQLATCLIAETLLDPGGTILFIASDKKLLLAAQLEGLAVWNPETA